FKGSPHLIETRQPKRISVHIFKSRESSAPSRFLWWRRKANSTLAPFVELGSDIFSEKESLAVPPNQFVFLGVGLRGDEGEVRFTIRRRNFYPPVARVGALIHDQTETELVQVES